MKNKHDSAAEEQYKRIYDVIPLCCSQWDERLGIIDCNLEALKLFGLKDKQEFLDRFFELSPEYQPDGKLSKDAASEIVARAFKDGRFVLEWVHQNLKGEPIPTMGTLVRVDKGNGQNVVLAFMRDLREEKKAKAKTKEAVQYTRIMMDATPMSSVLWDEKLNMIDCNLEALRVFGFEDEQAFKDRFFVDLMPERQPDGSVSTEVGFGKIKTAFEKGRNVFEWVHQNARGEPIPMEVTLVRIQHEGQNVVGGYMRDLREVRKAEAETIEAKNRMQLMLDESPLGCTFWDKDLNCIDCNLETLRMLGISSKQEYLEHAYRYSPEYQPDGRPSKEAAAENVARAFQEGRYVFEWLHQNVEGELIPTEMTLVRVSEENRHDAVLAFMRDLREVREAEAKTIEAKNRMQLMLDESPLCCTFWDENLNSIDCNLEATRMFGVPSKQEYLARFPELSPEYQPDGRLSREAAPASVARAFKEGRYVFEWMHKNLQGEPVPTEVTLVRVEEDNGRSVVLAFMRDLRQVREAEAKTVEAQKRMQLMLDESPLCCTFWDENLNSIDCNLEATRMFGVPSKQEYLARFHELSPEYQPDGRLSKEAAPASVLRAFKEGRYVFEWMHQNLQGEPVPTEVTLVRVDEGNGRSVVLAFMRDLREIKDKSAKLDVAEKLAFSDSLTGANNRRLFMQRASDEFHAQENVVSHIGIIMLDIDYFKRVNDTYGHEAGDEVLKLMATTVQNTLRGTDLFARYGGEEFIILVQQLDLNDLTKLAQRICKKIENTGFFYHGIKIPLTISAGVAIRKDMSYTIEEVIKHADMALYQAKLNGRNRVEAYNGDEPKERAGCASPSSPPTDGSDYVL